MTDWKSLPLSSVLQVALAGLAKLSFLGVSIVLYKTLPVEHIGLFSAVYAVAIILATFSECGLRGLLVRELARAQHAGDEAEGLLAATVHARLLTLLPYFGLGAVGCAIFASETSLPTVLLLLGAAWLDSNSGIFRGAIRAHGFILLDAALTAFVRLLLLALTTLLFLTHQLSMATFAALFFAVTAADTLATLAFVAIKTGIRLTIATNLQQTLAMLRRALPFVVVNIIGIIYLRLAILVLGAVPSPDALEQVAGYNLSARIPEGVAFLPIALMNALIPWLSRNSTDTEKIMGVFRRVEMVAGCAGIMISAGLFVFAEDLIWLMATPDYLPYKSTFQLYGITVFFSFLQYVYANLLICLNQEKWVARRYGLILLVNVFFTIALAVPYGAYGAVMALVLSEVLAVILDLHFLRRMKISINSTSMDSWATSGLLCVPIAYGLTAMGPLYGAATYFLISGFTGAYILTRARISHTSV